MKSFTAMLNEANQKIRNKFPDVGFDCKEPILKNGLITINFKVTYQEDFIDFFMEFSLSKNEEPIEDYDKDGFQSLSFNIGENSLNLLSNNILSSMNRELENCYSSKKSSNWVFDFLNSFMQKLQQSSFKPKQPKKKYMSQPEMGKAIQLESIHNEYGFKPYPSLNSFCWDPLGKLAVIRNLRYIDRKLEGNNGMREIYTVEQLNNYMVNCERKIRSENKLNILSNKDFMINDDEEENDFCVEFDKSLPIEADDDDEVMDFLNFQMKKKKATRDNKKKENDVNEDELNEEYLRDYFPSAISNPEIEKRFSTLLNGLDSGLPQKPRARNRFEFSSRFQVKKNIKSK